MERECGGPRTVGGPALSPKDGNAACPPSGRLWWQGEHDVCGLAMGPPWASSSMFSPLPSWESLLQCPCAQLSCSPFLSKLALSREKAALHSSEPLQRSLLLPQGSAHSGSMTYPFKGLQQGRVPPASWERADTGVCTALKVGS